MFVQMYIPMKIGTIVFAMLVLTMSIQAQDDYTAKIQHLRAEKDAELKSKKLSPLQKADRKAFDHLNYYPIDEAWNLEVDFAIVENGDTLDMMTSSGKTKQFYVYGRITIYHDGKRESLFAYNRIWPEGYVSEYPPSLFIPFKDHTTGNETYGGGRYLDIDIPAESGLINLDFNLCYNPYCAYGDGFSCPLPPDANDLDFEVKAGEKNYGEH